MAISTLNPVANVFFPQRIPKALAPFFENKPTKSRDKDTGISSEKEKVDKLNVLTEEILDDDGLLNETLDEQILPTEETMDGEVFKEDKETPDDEKVLKEEPLAKVSTGIPADGLKKTSDLDQTKMSNDQCQGSKISSVEIRKTMTYYNVSYMDAFKMMTDPNIPKIPYKLILKVMEENRVDEKQAVVILSKTTYANVVKRDLTMPTSMKIVSSSLSREKSKKTEKETKICDLNGIVKTKIPQKSDTSNKIEETKMDDQDNDKNKRTAFIKNSNRYENVNIFDILLSSKCQGMENENSHLKVCVQKKPMGKEAQYPGTRDMHDHHQKQIKGKRRGKNNNKKLKGKRREKINKGGKEEELKVLNEAKFVEDDGKKDLKTDSKERPAQKGKSSDSSKNKTDPSAGTSVAGTSGAGDNSKDEVEKTHNNGRTRGNKRNNVDKRKKRDKDDDDSDDSEDDDDSEYEEEEEVLNEDGEPKPKKPKLLNTQIKVLFSGRISPTEPVKVKLEVTHLVSKQSVIVNIPYHLVEEGKARIFITDRVGYPIYMAKNSANHSTDFKKYLDNLIKQSQPKGEVVNDQKEWIEFKDKEVIEKDGNFYFVCGPREVWKLIHPPEYVQKLSSQEIDELSFFIDWKDSKVYTFFGDVKETATKLLRILECLNLCQVPENYSYGLASLSAHFAGYSYRQLYNVYHGFSTTVTLSDGEWSTGKTLMANVIQYIFHMKKIFESIGNTEPSILEHLAEKKPIFVDEWYKYLNAFCFATQAIWNHSGKRVRGKELTPEAALFANANLLPDQLKLTPALASKVSFIWTGSTPLASDDIMTLTDEMETLAKELHHFLPVIYSFSLNVCLPRINDEQLKAYDGMLKRDRDIREAQILLNYDRLWALLKDCAQRYELRLPPLYDTDDIDRRALLHFNEGAVDVVAVNTIAVVKYAIKSNQIENLVRTTNEALGDGYVVVDSETFPSRIQDKLKKLPRHNTTVSSDGNRTKKRFPFLSEKKIPSKMRNVLDLALISYDITLVQSLKDAEHKKDVMRESIAKSVTKQISSEKTKKDELTCLKKDCPDYNKSFGKKSLFERHLKTKKHQEPKKTKKNSKK